MLGAATICICPYIYILSSQACKRALPHAALQDNSTDSTDWRKDLILPPAHRLVCHVKTQKRPNNTPVYTLTTQHMSRRAFNRQDALVLWRFMSRKHEQDDIEVLNWQDSAANDHSRNVT